MVRGEIDLNDAVVSPFFVLASGVQANLFDLTLFGVNFADPLVTLGSGAGAIDITIANLIMVGALVVAFVTNRPQLDSMTGVEIFVAVATVGLVVAPPFSPAIESLIQSSAIARLVALVIQAAD